jgi:hypothetical protein
MRSGSRAKVGLSARIPQWEGSTARTLAGSVTGKL